MIIGQIVDGIVLDHITAGKGIEIYKALGLENLDCTVAMIFNADSVKMGKKDILKIGVPIEINLDILGLIDPGITVNFIKGGTVAKREHISLPERIRGLIRCKNPRCITTTEQELVQEFRLCDESEKVYRCIYCETKADLSSLK